MRGLGPRPPVEKKTRINFPHGSVATNTLIQRRAPPDRAWPRAHHAGALLSVRLAQSPRSFDTCESRTGTTRAFGGQQRHAVAQGGHRATERPSLREGARGINLEGLRKRFPEPSSRTLLANRTEAFTTRSQGRHRTGKAAALPRPATADLREDALAVRFRPPASSKKRHTVRRSET